MLRDGLLEGPGVGSFCSPPQLVAAEHRRSAGWVVAEHRRQERLEAQPVPLVAEERCEVGLWGHLRQQAAVAGVELQQKGRAELLAVAEWLALGP